MFPPRCSSPACVNIAVNGVNQVGIGSLTPVPHATWLDCSSSQCWPGCVISYGMNP